MADIAAQPFINYGASQAQQGQAQAAAALQTQQARGAAMQNKIQAARLPFIMKMYEQMGATADTSGVDGQGEAGGPLQSKQDKLDENGFDADQITQRNNSKYFVPEWTDQEKQFNLNAAATVDEGVVKYAALQRQQRLDLMHQRAQYDSLNTYAKYAAAASAPSAYAALQQSDKPYTDWLDKFAAANPDIDKEEAARGYARYQAADLHKYTGRKVDFKDGHAIDADNGLPVAGVPDLQMAPKDTADFMRTAQTPSIEVATGVPGQTKKITPWQAAGYRNVHDYLAAVEQGAAPSPAQWQTMTAGKPLTANELANLRASYKQNAIGNAAAGNAPAPYKPTDHPAPDPANPGALVPMPTHPKPQKPTAASGGQVPQGAPAQPTTANRPARAPIQPSNAPFQGNETLPGVDSSKLPRYQVPQNAPNTSASTEQNLDLAAHNKEKYNQINNANVSNQKNATERNLLDQAQNEITQLRQNPRAIGPGSAVTTAWNEFLSYATGKAPDPLIERKMFDKILLQLGAANVKAAFDGQSKIGQQEYMKLLTEGNPTGSMPLDAIQKLVNFARYNNEFDTRLNNTRVDALNRGADPYSRQFSNLNQGRAAYVQSRMGSTPQEDKSSWETKSYQGDNYRLRPGADRKVKANWEKY
jgi:hypothetical protein